MNGPSVRRPRRRNSTLPIAGFLAAGLSALSLSVVAPARANEIPTPESILGHEVGADYFLASYAESVAYFEKLAEASDRVRLETVGTTSFGRQWKMAILSSPENLANLERLREIAQRLAHPEGLGDEEARALAREGRVFVHIDNGLHATEVAHAQHAIQLAYDLATETEDPEILAILDRTVLLLWFSINPDGQDMVVDWYRSNLGTPYEVAPMVRLYQKYVGHDNNRDGYMLATHESRITTRVIRHYEPQLLYNHHQTAPFPARIWIPPFAEPVSPHVHPLMWRTVNLVGMAMAHALEERGQEGAMHTGTEFDNWYPGFIDHANNFHNVASFLTETGLYKYATPHFYEVSDFPKKARDLRPQSLYASPWKGGWWRLGDAVDYMLTASKAVLDVAAKYKEDLLYNRYQAGRDVIELYRQEPPHAFFVPRDQRDPVAVVELLRRLAFNGIEIHRLKTKTRFAGETFEAGTWVIPMDQPFAHFVRQLFSIQSYPDLRQYSGGPPDHPYDMSGWTLPLQMGVRVVPAEEPLGAELRSKLEPVRGKAEDPMAEKADEIDAAPFDSPLGIGFDSHPVAAGLVPAAGRIEGKGQAVALDPRQNNSFRALGAAWDGGASVSREEGTGRYLVRNWPQAEAVIERLAVRAERTDASGIAIQRPRLAVYRPFTRSKDEGWSRWILERFGIEHENVGNAEIRSGSLARRFDVLLLADMRPREIREGHAPGTVPARYVGGLGGEGVRALDAFVRQGGVVVALNRSCAFVIDELHLPVVDIAEELDESDFFVGGSIVEVEVDGSHPVMAGYEDRAVVPVDRSPVFAADEGFSGRVLAKYPEAGSPLRSGYLLGETYLRGKAAAVEVAHGKGRVLLLGMRPQWRAQPFGSFPIFFNALLYRPTNDGSAPSSEAWRLRRDSLDDVAEP